MRPVVTLLTDFGLQDTFVGQIKGVLLSHRPDISIVDLTHEIPPQAIFDAAMHLSAAWRAFPAGTIHLAVVDPGVGTQRRAIVASYQGHMFVLPDNGLISSVLGADSPDLVVEISGLETPSGPVSRTFHGRDVFAPAAGRLAAGASPETLGRQLDPSALIRLELPVAVVQEDSIEGEIVLIDRFGNAITNIRSDDLRQDLSSLQVSVGSFRLNALSETYQDVDSGTPLALVSSMDTLELAVRDGSAAEQFNLHVGMKVFVWIQSIQ